LGIALLIFAGIALFTDSPTDFKPACEAAAVIAENYVEMQLISPKSADFPWLDYNCWRDAKDSNTFLVKSYVDAENAFGAMIRHKYECKLRYISGDWADPRNWELISLTFY